MSLKISFKTTQKQPILIRVHARLISFETAPESCTLTSRPAPLHSQRPSNYMTGVKIAVKLTEISVAFSMSRWKWLFCYLWRQGAKTSGNEAKRKIYLSKRPENNPWRSGCISGLISSKTTVTWIVHPEFLKFWQTEYGQMYEISNKPVMYLKWYSQSRGGATSKNTTEHRPRSAPRTRARSPIATHCEPKSHKDLQHQS